MPEMVSGLERRLGMTSQRSAETGGELSERELELLRSLAGPASLREIAGELFISHNTAKTHAKSIYAKLGAASREAAVERARQLHLIR
jgi:LuxR family maltose regulon positive regulatory protein